MSFYDVPPPISALRSLRGERGIAPPTTRTTARGPDRTIGGIRGLIGEGRHVAASPTSPTVKVLLDGGFHGARIDFLYRTSTGAPRSARTRLRRFRCPLPFLGRHELQSGR
jgi:hypothetical protein